MAVSTSAASQARRGKQSRHDSAQQARQQSRAAALERRRHVHAPVIIQMLSLSSHLDHQAMWYAAAVHVDAVLHRCRAARKLLQASATCKINALC